MCRWFELIQDIVSAITQRFPRKTPDLCKYGACVLACLVEPRCQDAILNHKKNFKNYKTELFLTSYVLMPSSQIKENERLLCRQERKFVCWLDSWSLAVTPTPFWITGKPNQKANCNNWTFLNFLKMFLMTQLPPKKMKGAIFVTRNSQPEKPWTEVFSPREIFLIFILALRQRSVFHSTPHKL